nr:calcineurin phosphoesterase [Hymenolepis microstoma]
MDSAIAYIKDRRYTEHLNAQSEDFTFVILSDPQLALIERYGEKRDPPYKWDRELALVNRAISAINSLSRKPKFVIVCGDLVDAEPGRSERGEQISDLKSAFVKITPGVPIFTLPGNHDVGNSPCTADIEDYKSHWGDDYYSFWCGKVKSIVINSQLYFNSKNCPTESEAQDAWLNAELCSKENQNAEKILVFQVCYKVAKKSSDEDDDYFVIPKEARVDLMNRYYKAGIRHVFSGHVHYNVTVSWRPEGSNSTPLENITTSAVCFQLGDDKPGLRIVHVTPTNLTHKCVALARSFHNESQLSKVPRLPSLRSKLESVREFDIPLTTGKSMKPKSARFLPSPSTEKSISDSNTFRVSAYGIGQSINLDQLSFAMDYQALGYRCLRLPPEVANEILFFTTPSDVHDPVSHRDILVFKTGVVVFWNVSDSESEDIINKLRSECNRPMALELMEFEELVYSFTSGPTVLDIEDIRFHAVPTKSDSKELQEVYEKEVQRLVLEKIAFSDALAASVKLSLLESSFDAVAVQMQPWIDKMQIGLGVFFPMSAVFRKTGELFTLRHLLNISTTISETPDFYWDRPDVEKLFQNLKTALSVQSRTNILNSKLNTCCELTEILTNHLEARHSSRLEWMIILLILIEVIFEISRWNVTSDAHQENSNSK